MLSECVFFFNHHTADISNGVHCLFACETVCEMLTDFLIQPNVFNARAPLKLHSASLGAPMYRKSTVELH